MRKEELTGLIEIEELTEESTEILTTIGGSTNSTKNTCRCPGIGFDGDN